jgi:hypothetical protein
VVNKPSTLLSALELVVAVVAEVAVDGLRLKDEVKRPDLVGRESNSDSSSLV